MIHTLLIIIARAARLCMYHNSPGIMFKEMAANAIHSLQYWHGQCAVSEQAMNLLCLMQKPHLCCVCVCACVRACVCECVRACLYVHVCVYRTSFTLLALCFSRKLLPIFPPGSPFSQYRALEYIYHYPFCRTCHVPVCISSDEELRFFP